VVICCAVGSNNQCSLARRGRFHSVSFEQQQKNVVQWWIRDGIIMNNEFNVIVDSIQDFETQ
jgi:hypothetical protein